MLRSQHTRFFLTRLVFLPLSLLLLTLVCFLLAQLAPGDPVRHRMAAEGSRAAQQNLLAYEQNYRRLAEALGYDRPSFYFTLTNATLPDTLYRIVDLVQRENVRRLAHRYGNWPAVQAYFREVRRIAYASGDRDDRLVATARRLLVRDDPHTVQNQLTSVSGPLAEPLLWAHAQMVQDAEPSRILLPRLYWNGTNNRYHSYLSGLLRGDLGISLSDSRPVATKIGQALPRTLVLNGLALFLVYAMAIPLGLYMAYWAGSAFDRGATLLTFLAFGIPSFWVATLLANFLTTPAFGMDWFPSMGFGRIPEGTSWLEAVQIRGAHLFLPVLCLAYPSWAYVSRHLRSSTLAELDKAYVRTALMKGLAGPQVLWRHVFRNASFPLVTLLGGLLPSLVAGSVLIENIFNVPGMGRLLYQSALARDWPVVTALVLITGLLTVVGLLLADIGYALLDPRVRLVKSTDA